MRIAKSFPEQLNDLIDDHEALVAELEASIRSSREFIDRMVAERNQVEKCPYCQSGEIDHKPAGIGVCESCGAQYDADSTRAVWCEASTDPLVRLDDRYSLGGRETF